MKVTLFIHGKFAMVLPVYDVELLLHPKIGEDSRIHYWYKFRYNKQNFEFELLEELLHSDHKLRINDDESFHFDKEVMRKLVKKATEVLPPAFWRHEDDGNFALRGSKDFDSPQEYNEHLKSNKGD
jgi:hypothetical protein